MLNGLARGALAAALWLALAAGAAQLGGSEPRWQPRLDTDALIGLIDLPARRLDKGDLAGAEAAFASELRRQAVRHGERSSAVADHLSAFGLVLFLQERPERLASLYKSRSLIYLRRAIPRYRAAYGAGNPETALAIGTYAAAALQVAPDDPPRDLEVLLDEAYRIRAAALGPGSADAAAALLQIAELRGTPSRTRGDAARIAEAADVYRRASDAFETAPGAVFGQTPSGTHLKLAAMYSRNGYAAEAVAAGRRAGAIFPGSERNDHVGCMLFATSAAELVDSMKSRGQHSEAEELRRYFERDVGCFGGSGDIPGLLPELPVP
jgi:hypothetical protein